MTQANIAVNITLRHEGAPDYGINDTLKAEYRKTLSNKAAFDKLSQKEKAILTLTWAFNNKGFAKYEDQEVANFLFDTYVHLKTMYYTLVTFLSGNGNDIQKILKTFDIPSNAYKTINTFCNDEDGKKMFLAQCKFYRRRMERCYPKWSRKEEPQKGNVYFTAFDKRIFSFPYTMQCVPSDLEKLNKYAVIMAYWVTWSYYENKPSYDKIMKEVAQNIGYKLDVVATGIWGESAFVDITACDAPNEIVRRVDISNDSNSNFLLYGIGLYAAYNIFK